jgi:hypothetical protein
VKARSLSPAESQVVLTLETEGQTELDIDDIARLAGGPALADDMDDFLAVRVHDGTSWSAWNETLFHTNAPPPAPAPLTPADAASCRWTQKSPRLAGE